MKSNMPLLLGESIFTSMRSINGAVPRLDSHLKRLFDNVNDYYFNYRLEMNQFLAYYFPEKKLENLLEAYPNHYIRMTFVNDSAQLNLDHGLSDLHLNISAQKKPLYFKKPYQCKLIESPFSQSFKTIKAGSYFQNLYAKKMALREGFEEAIFTRGDEILEATTSNLILWDGKSFVTPMAFGILSGINLEVFEDFCKNTGRSFLRRTIKISELQMLDMPMLSNSVQLLTPIGRINSIVYKEEKSYKLINEFHQYLGLEHEKN